MNGFTISQEQVRPRSATGMGRRLRALGFSLLELMIVVAIIAILSAIAYPSYISHVTKTNRVAAEGCLSEFSNWMERYYTTNLNYPVSSSSVPFSTMDCATAQQTGNNYQYDFQTAQPTSYVLKATPQGAQLTRDTKCGTLTLDQKGARGIVGGTGTVQECW